MKLRNNLLLGLVALTASLTASQAATIGITSINPADTASDTGTGVIIVVTSWDGDLGTTGVSSPAALTPGEAVTTIGITNETAGSAGTITPLIFESTGGGTGFNVIAIGAPISASGAFTPTSGSATLPTPASGEALYAGFYMDLPSIPSTIGFVGEFNGANPDDDGLIFFQNGVGMAPGLGAITVSGNLDRTYNFSATTAPIPEPSSALLGLVGLGLLARRRR